VFEVDTMSIHDTDDSGALHKEIGDEIRHVCLPQELDPTKNYFLKSHNIEYVGFSKVIYVVRDGRCACVSYYHHLNDNGRPTSYDEVFNGVVYGSWSFHLDIWMNVVRSEPTSDKLLLRYEDMINNPDLIIEQLSAFCELQPKNKWVNEFDRLHRTNPQFFRKGDNEASIMEFNSLEEESKNTFWTLHSRWMSELNYETGIPNQKSTIHEGKEI